MGALMIAGLADLLRVLDAQAALVDELIEVAIRERDHLIAFEPHKIQACVDEKRALMERERALEEQRQDALADVLEALGVTEADVATVEDLAPLLPGDGAEAIRTRATALRERVATLKAHHTVNQEHTERAVRWVHAYVGLLRGASEPAPSNRYAPSGRSTQAAQSARTSTVHRRA